jgi:hypothetical protein
MGDGRTAITHHRSSRFGRLEVFEEIIADHVLVILRVCPEASPREALPASTAYFE